MSLRELSIQTNDIFGIVTLSLGALTLALSFYVLILAIRARSEISTYLSYNQYFKSVIELGNQSQPLNVTIDNTFLSEQFSGTQKLLGALDEARANKIMLYLKAIAGELSIDENPGKPSKELSNHCLESIKACLQTEDGVFIDDDANKLYQMLEIHTRRHQISQPSIESMPLRLTADAFLILSSIGMHLLIGFSIGAAALVWPLFAIGLVSLIIFTYNEFNDFKRKHFILGMATTYIAFIMMLVIFAGVVGGIGIPLIIVIAACAKKLFMQKNELIEKDLESKIKSLTTDEPLNQSNKQRPGLHPAEDDKIATKSLLLLKTKDPEHEDDN